MENVKSKGFSLTKMISNNNGDNKFLSLEAKGDESNNKTRIKCRAMAGQSQPVYSEVLLLIQGMFDHNDLLLTACKHLFIRSLVYVQSLIALLHDCAYFIYI